MAARNGLVDEASVDGDGDDTSLVWEGLSRTRGSMLD